MINTIGKKKLEGIIPALILPLEENGEININFLKKQVNYLSSAGANGVFINGTTGEGGWLTIEEKAKIFKLAKEISEGKIFLCAASTGIDQGSALSGGNAEIGSRYTQCVDVDGSMPIVAVQMNHFLGVERCLHERLAVVEKILDRLSDWNIAIAKHPDFSF